MTSKDRRFIYDAVWVLILTIGLVTYEVPFDNIWVNIIHFVSLASLWIYHIVRIKISID
tara:strand:- start:289 stop:465 length:177 start_codon:yes stop_codon:yes gene_type:complete